jgi:hypothetical protein
MRIRDPRWKKFESGINITDPQHLNIIIVSFLVKTFDNSVVRYLST